jgi:beta-N-acetylhexosaminidase
LCNGLEVYVLNRKAFNPVVMGLTVIKTIHDMYPHKFAFSEASHFDHLIGNRWVRKGIENGMSIQAMQDRWQKRLKQFKAEREKYLLY